MAAEAGEVAAHGFDLVPVVALLGAAVVAVPLFKRLGLGPVLGYLAAGLAIGPYGVGLFHDPQAILHIAELGVVLFLFVIGLEMQPSRLWSMRREIFGLGLAQVGVCMLLLWTVGLSLGYPLAPSLIAGTGFVLTSTAIVMQMLEDRGMLALPPGRRIIAILLFEDLSIVPLLALVAFLAPGGAEATLGDRLRLGRDRPRLDRRARRRRPLAPEPDVPHARQRPRPRAPDRRRAPRRARRRARDAGRRPLDGDGRLPRRRHALRIRPTATSSRPTSSRSAASCSASSS